MQVKVYITLILILELHTFPDLSLFYLASDSQKYPHQSSDLQHLIHLTKKGLLHFERLYLNVVYSLWLKWSSLSSQGTMPCCVLSLWLEQPYLTPQWFWLPLNSACTSSKLSCLSLRGWARIWEGTEAVQLTQTNLRDIPYCASSCSEIKILG